MKNVFDWCNAMIEKKTPVIGKYYRGICPKAAIFGHDYDRYTR